MNLLEGSRSLMEGERGLLFCFGRAGMSKRKKIVVGKRMSINTPSSPMVT